LPLNVIFGNTLLEGGVHKADMAYVMNMKEVLCIFMKIQFVLL